MEVRIRRLARRSADQTPTEVGHLNFRTFSSALRNTNILHKINQMTSPHHRHSFTPHAPRPTPYGSRNLYCTVLFIRSLLVLILRADTDQDPSCQGICILFSNMSEELEFPTSSYTRFSSSHLAATTIIAISEIPVEVIQTTYVFSM